MRVVLATANRGKVKEFKELLNADVVSHIGIF